MRDTYAEKEKHDQDEGDVCYCSTKSDNLMSPDAIYITESETWALVKGIKPRKKWVLDLSQSETDGSLFRQFFLEQSHNLGITVPKHLVSLEEKYLRRCFELMHISASKAASCALSMNFGSSDVGFMPEYVTVSGRNSSQRAKHAIGYPINMGTVDLDLSPFGDGIVGSLMRSSSMISILESSLFQRLGISDHEVRLGGASLFENKKCNTPDYRGSPSSLSLSPPWKPGKKVSVLRNQEYRSDSLQQSPISMSSGLYIPTDQSSASYLSPPDSQGMLQCTWEGGIPHFAFSLDDRKEFYVANACKVEVANDKALDYIYSFHLKSTGQKMFDYTESESDLVAKMKVSTSFLVCPNNSKVMETEFVLADTSENHAVGAHELTQNNRRNRKLSKVMEVFKSGHLFKHRTPSLFGGTTGIPVELYAEKGLDICRSLNKPQKVSSSECDFVPNLEMAAIVVKDHIQHEQIDKEMGGWGLKFLKKAKIKQNPVSSDASSPAQGYLNSVSQCSSSMDIIVPAGLHGGPKSRDGGPTSLIERWKLGGHCDCGGWDLGCPLKVLKANLRKEVAGHSPESPSDCKSFDFFTEGSMQTRPTLKMVNIHQGLYFISFQSSSLSPLQCFSIAVAIVHSQSPSVRPKHVHD